jgi:hypothetical protein
MDAKAASLCLRLFFKRNTGAPSFLGHRGEARLVRAKGKGTVIDWWKLPKIPKQNQAYTCKRHIPALDVSESLIDDPKFCRGKHGYFVHY